MRFFIDQDVYQMTVDFLSTMGYDVLRVKEAGLSTAEDEDILHFALEQQRILLTRDKDFGGLVFLSKHENPGVILLRMNPENVDSVHRELSRFLDEHKNEDFKNCFIVIEPSRHRIRTSSL